MIHKRERLKQKIILLKSRRASEHRQQTLEHPQKTTKGSKAQRIWHQTQTVMVH